MNRKIIKVLHIGVSTETGVFGGVEKYLTDYYSAMNHDIVHFDFAFCRNNSLISVQNHNFMKDSKIYAFRALKDSENSFKEYKDLYKKLVKLLLKESYDIVHVDTALIPAQITCLYAAKRSNIKIRIAHSHSAGGNPTGSIWKKYTKKFLYRFSKKIICSLATDYFACSKAAGINLFGKKGCASKKFNIINNAIDANKYRFNNVKREKTRQKYGIDKNTVVFGSVGRLDPIKNHSFMLDIFNKYHKENPNSVLWIIGNGPVYSQINNKIKEYQLDSSVIMFGEQYDVENFMQGMDVFLFTSFLEGLGISAIEAQASGLLVFASDTVPIETKITNLITYISLKKDVSEWVSIIQKKLSLQERSDTFNYFVSSGYEINSAAKLLQEKYIELIQ